MKKRQYRIFSIFLSLLLTIAFTVPAFAQIDVDIHVDHKNISIQGYSDYKQKPVMIKVEGRNKKAYIDEEMTDEKGQFQFSFQVEEGKDYKGKINISGEKEEFTFQTKKDSSGGSSDKKLYVNLSVEGYNGKILSKSNIEIHKNDTVGKITRKIFNEEGISYEATEGYFSSIAGQREKDKGPYSGWMYNINGNTTNVGADQYRLTGGEDIKWYYTLDYRTDKRNTSMGGGGGKPVDIGKEIEKVKKVLENKNANEDEIKKAIKDMTHYMNEKIEKMKTKEEEKECISEMKNVSQKMQEVVEHMKDPKEVKEMSEKIIDVNGKLIDKIGKEKGKEVIESTAIIAQKAVEKMSIKNIDQNQIKLEGQRAIGKVETQTIQEIIKDANSIKEKIKNKMGKNITQEKITIVVPTTNKKEVEATLPSGMMSLLKENNIQKAVVQTEYAAFAITPQIFDTEDTITLIAKDIDQSECIDIVKNKVGEENKIVDVTAKIGQNFIKEFKIPMKVSIPYKGEVKNGEVVQAFYLKDNGIIENMGGVYDKDTKMITFETTHFSKYFAQKVGKEEVKSTFNDLVGYEWATKAIEEMAQKGIISGRSEDVFDPSASITRAEFATLITKMLGLNIENEKLRFIDVEDTAWYTPYVKTAYKNGFVSGRNETIFDPNGKITREEMATIIGKVLIQKGKEKANINELERFNDKTNIASWASENIALCVKESMISGMPDGNFMPKQNANRAQAAMMLYNLYKSIK
ncbi:S-layer homology domain-containing protein [Inediibacterium massiliense]|uniref:S-layer homology domain-containing protein n=1 Tax=Inediibacterium massiliense TaxID=1658111 RepID=UPI0006B49E60|nr:S-layer homology domain-containing protein [Inediibacterium massiliense]